MANHVPREKKMEKGSKEPSTNIVQNKYGITNCHHLHLKESPSEILAGMSDSHVAPRARVYQV